MIGLLIVSLLLPFGVGCASLALRRRPRLAGQLASYSVLASSLLMATMSIGVMVTGERLLACIPWDVPLGSFSLGMDPLSAVFILPIAIVVSAAVIYGREYLALTTKPARIASSWFFFNSLVTSMWVLVSARNGLLFLFAWEGMTLASFFLVLTEHEQESVRRAAWIYAAAAHLGTACLFVLFLLLGRDCTNLDFTQFHATPANAGTLFLLALVGFGTKAGFVGLHIWLPEAHPSAPSHVSAVMSGVMIKTGIYGLLRVLTFLGDVPAWWGWTLLGVGLATALFGVLLAIAQQDLKRMLAYSSVENIGIVAMGIGVGLVGLAYDIPSMAACALLGALLHVLNHALFKSLMFLGAGAIQASTKTRDMNLLGGLLKRMPATGATFLVGAWAITGLPPLNGFLGEGLIVFGALSGVAITGALHRLTSVVLCVLVVGGLSLIGGLSVACFTRAFGCVFLGEPRSAMAEKGHEGGGGMRAGMLILAASCIVVALTAPLWSYLYRYPVLALGSMDQTLLIGGRSDSWSLLLAFGFGCWLLTTVSLVVWWMRRRWMGVPSTDRGPTWDCGYASPQPRMQYTASSFSSPFVTLFRVIIRPRIRLMAPMGFFPDRSRFESESPDLFTTNLFGPILKTILWAAARFRRMQQGRIQLYVLYIAMTLIALLVWKLN